ncbi:hypothetical protein IAU60_005796 [Kwoniella sp. DSM 27419]
MPPFDLTTLGAELDAARQWRKAGVRAGAQPMDIDRSGGASEDTTVHVEEVLGSSVESVSEDEGVVERAGRGQGIVGADDSGSSYGEGGDIEMGMRTPGTMSRPRSPTVRDDQGVMEGVRLLDITEKEEPYPLCLLCLTRPPTAVLLPCCHLNLCHLCAPLLIQRHRPPSPHAHPAATATASTPTSSNMSYSQSSSTSGRPPSSSWTQGDLSQPASPAPAPPNPETVHAPAPAQPQTQQQRIPYNLLLQRATANHAKSRALARGGYLAPTLGTCGGEMRGQDLVPDRGEGARDGTGLHRVIGEDGRVSLTLACSDARAKCLVCRQGIMGWLKVYTG